MMEPGAFDGQSFSATMSGISGGIIALIVIVIAVVLCAVGLCVLCILRKRGSFGGNNDMVVVPNSAYNTPAEPTANISNAVIPPTSAVPNDFGAFNCPQCGKEYQYGDDLKQHLQLRHP